MKNKIFKILIALFAISLNLYSQNNIDPPTLPNINFNDTTVFKKYFSDFIRGWNYGDTGRQLDILNSINFNLCSWETTNDTMPWRFYGDSINWYLRIKPLGFPSDESVGGCQAVYYEPAITVDTNESFTAGPENIEGAVFGFI
jgi:hypothetical protein